MNDSNLFGSRAIIGGQDPNFATHAARDRFIARQRSEKEQWNLLAARLLSDLPRKQRRYALHVARADQDARMDFLPALIPATNILIIAEDPNGDTFLVARLDHLRAAAPLAATVSEIIGGVAEVQHF